MEHVHALVQIIFAKNSVIAVMNAQIDFQVASARHNVIQKDVIAIWQCENVIRTYV